jgi:RNA polymerase sigma-70 factor, ECF subfamily
VEGSIKSFLKRFAWHGGGILAKNGRFFAANARQLGSILKARRPARVLGRQFRGRCPMQSDSQLVSLALQGDQAAFATLVGRYERAARVVAFHRIADHHAAEDAAQEAFITAYRKLSSLRERSLFGQWLLTIVRRQAERIGRALRRNAPLDDAAQVAEPDKTNTDNDSEFLFAAVMGLPERERRLLILRHFGGHSVADIARMTGRPVGTVTKQLSRAYARLRQRFAKV